MRIRNVSHHSIESVKLQLLPRSCERREELKIDRQRLSIRQKKNAYI